MTNNDNPFSTPTRSGKSLSVALVQHPPSSPVSPCEVCSGGAGEGLIFERKDGQGVSRFFHWDCMPESFKLPGEQNPFIPQIPGATSL